MCTQVYTHAHDITPKRSKKILFVYSLNINMGRTGLIEHHHKTSQCDIRYTNMQVPMQVVVDKKINTHTQGIYTWINTHVHA